MEKTIVYFGGFELPDRNAAAHRVLNNAKILRKIGYKIVFCGIDKTIKENATTSINVCGFESYPLAYPKKSIGWIKQLYTFKPIKSVINKYNAKIVIAYNMHAPQLKNLIKFCKKNHIIIIGDITEWYDNFFSLNPIKFIKWIDNNRTMKVLNKKLDGIISISSFLKMYYENYVNNIIILPPLVDVTEDKWKQKNEKNNVFTIVYSGNPGKTKDKLSEIFIFLSSVEKNFIFNVIGLTKEQYLSLFPNDQKLLDILDNKVSFLGYINHFDSIRYLLNADMCIILREASKKNNAGFPTKFVESITSGTFTIINRFSDIDNYSFLDNCCIIDICEIEKISDYIGHNFVKNVNKEFDYNNYIDYIKRFMNIIEGKKLL